MASFTFPLANIKRQNRINPFDEVDTSTPNLDTLSSHVNDMPNREDYQLGTKDRIMNAIIGGMTGFTSGAGKALETTRQNYDRPYQQASTDWSLKGRGLSEAADAESRQVNSRLRDAQLQENHLQNIDELDQRATESELRRQAKAAELEETNRRNTLQDENVDALRKQTQTYQDRMAGASEDRARASLINANRKRTRNQGKPSPIYKSYKESSAAALDSLLAEMPAFEDFLDITEEGPIVRRDANKKPVKRWIDEKGEIHLIPMGPKDLEVVRNFNQKLRQRNLEFSQKVRQNQLEDEDDQDEME